MSALLEMLVTASLVSGAAIACLRLIPGAPPRLRFRIALAGLAAWAVPWPLLHVPIEMPATRAVAEWRDGVLQAGGNPASRDGSAEASLDELAVAFSGGPVAESSDGLAAAPRERRAPASSDELASASRERRILASSDGLAGAPGDPSASAAARPHGAVARADGSADPSRHALIRLGAPGWLILLILPGAVRFLSDVLALRRSVAGWRAASRPADELRASLPGELRNARAEIRLVSGSLVAATSGWFRPTVWLGASLRGRDRQVALVHELVHVSRHDPVWITFVTAVRRVWWCNPVVGWLGREAVLMMEADCDRRCARWVGTDLYVERLASMMLDAVAASSPRLAAHARTPNLNVQRLKLLAHPPRMRRRDYVVIALTSCLAVTSAAYALSEPASGPASAATDATSAAAGVAPPTAPADRAASAARAATPSASAARVATPSAPADRVVSLSAPAARAAAPAESVGTGARRPALMPETPAGRTLGRLLGAYNASDTERLAELLGAFTPMEVAFRVPSSSGGLDVIEIIASEPMRVDYVARDRVGGAQRVGVLELDPRAPMRIVRADIVESIAGRAR